MDKIVDHLFVFKGQGEVEDFPGNYSDYRSYEGSANPVSEKTEAPSPSKNDWKTSTEEKKLNYNEQKEFKRLEKDIPKLEREKEALQKEFLKELTEEEIKEKSIELQKIIDDIDKKTERWFELSAIMEGEV